MKSRTRDQRSSDELKTARQWAKLGYVAKDGETGEEMWTNCFCRQTAVYFTSEQVKSATKEEIDAFFAPERAVRRERAAKVRDANKAIRNRKNLIQNAMELPPIEVANHSGIVVFDVETTGLDAIEDEILQFSAIDGDGNVLLDTYVRPYIKKEWMSAQRIHGISPAYVAHAPQMHELIPLLRGIFASANLLVSYNGTFDMDFLAQSGIKLYDIEHYDVMKEFAPIYGDWNEYHQNYKWQKLSTCASYFGYEFKAHDSLEDVRATLFCYREMVQKKRG